MEDTEYSSDLEDTMYSLLPGAAPVTRRGIDNGNNFANVDSLSRLAGDLLLRDPAVRPVLTGASESDIYISHSLIYGQICPNGTNL